MACIAVWPKLRSATEPGRLLCSGAPVLISPNKRSTRTRQSGRDYSDLSAWIFERDAVRLVHWQPEEDDNFFIQHYWRSVMRKSAMTPDALPHRGTAASFRVAIG